jgi:2-phospho-L-lactate guanylyltransferase
VSWVAVVPVKGAPGAKSRLGDHPERLQLAEAFALDTVTVLLAASVVSRVVVVTADEQIGERLHGLGAEVVREVASPPGTDRLNPAIEQATDAVRRSFPQADLAVFTGDLPCLTVSEVESALALAEAHERSMVADRDGTGTTVLLALAGVPFTPRFGPGSRSAHEAAGHVPLDLPLTSSVRRDVDTADDLSEALRVGVGPHTRFRVQNSGTRQRVAPAGAAQSGATHLRS